MLRKPLDQTPERRKSESANPDTTSNSSEKAKVFNSRRPSGGEWRGGEFVDGRELGEANDLRPGEGRELPEGGIVRDRSQSPQERQSQRDPQAEAIKLRAWVAETLRNSAPPSHAKDHHAESEEDEDHSCNQQNSNPNFQDLPTLDPPLLLPSNSTPAPQSNIQSAAAPRSRALEKRRADPSYESPSELGLDLRTRPTSMHALNEYSHQEVNSIANAVSTPSSPSRNVLQGGLKAFKLSAIGSSSRNVASLTDGTQEKSEMERIESEGIIKKKRVQIDEDLPKTSDGGYFYPASYQDPATDFKSSGLQEARTDINHQLSSPYKPNISSSRNSLGQDSSTPSPQPRLDYLSATRVGMGVGMGAIGASSDINDLMNQDSRRPSLTEGLPSPALGFDREPTHSRNPSTPSASNPNPPSLQRQFSNVSIGTRDERAEKMGMAPRLSHSTLLDLGRMEGLTPDARDNPFLNLIDPHHQGYSNHSTSAGALPPSSSVVSAGLEMGLGMNLASSALFNALPGSSLGGTAGTSRAINYLSEPRYSHQNSASMVQSLNSLSNNESISARPRVSVTTRELDRPGRASVVQGMDSRQSSPPQHSTIIGVQASSTIYSPVVGGVNAARLPSLNSRANLSEQGVEEQPPLSAIDRAESELARRRTTGSNNERGWQAGKTRAAVHAAKEAGKPRVMMRAGTADSFPNSSSSRASMGITPLTPALESTSPTSDSQRRGSTASSNQRDSPYSYSSNAPLSQHPSTSDHNSSFDSKTSFNLPGFASASGSNASNTTGSVSTSAWYSSNARSAGSSSTQAGTPSLGERALLSPEANSHMEDQSEFPLSSHSVNSSHQPHLAHGGSGGRQSTVMPIRGGSSTNAQGGVRFGGSGGEDRPPPRGINPLSQGMAGGIGNLAASGLGAGANAALPHLAPAQGALMGVGSGSHFGPGVRAKVAEVLAHLIDTIPINSDSSSTSQSPSKEEELDEEQDIQTTICIGEYGALNSRSMQLMQGIISQFSQRINSNLPSTSNSAGRKERETLRRGAGPSSMGLGRKPSARSNLAQSYFGGDMNVGSAGRARASSLQRSSSLEDARSRVSFCITHEDSSIADFRALNQLLDTHPESYLSPHFQTSSTPSLQNHIFPSFVARPFASRIAPPKSFHLGFSLMDLHWSHTPRNTAVSLATTAHAELTAFLTARSNEFRKGGIFLMAYIARSDEKTGVDSSSSSNGRLGCSSTPASPLLNQATSSSSAPGSRPPMHARSSSTPYEFSTRAHPPSSSTSSPGRAGVSNPGSGHSGGRDIWTTLTNSLAPCLQRLVSCGMLKSELARALLILPMHPRTANQTKAVLKGLRHVWKVEWSCGLGEGEQVPLVSEDQDEDDESGFSSSRRASRESGENDGSSVSNLGDAEGAASGFKSNQKELKSEPSPLRLAHPAWKAFQAGTLSKVAFTEHMLQLYKNLFEGHFRAVLREKGKLSKGAVEFVIDSLWDVLYSKIEDQQPIIDVEIEVGICALRRV